MTDFTFDPSGNVVESLVDHGDGAGTRTVYDEAGDVLSVEEVDGLPLPAPPTVEDATTALLAAVAEPLLIAHADRIDPASTAVFAAILTDWTVGEPVAVDALRSHDGVVWQAVQAHTTQDDWTPEKTPALWRRWRDPDAGPAPWVQPTGSSDAYAKGARVTHKGSVWESLVAANVWEPTAGAPTLWKEIK